MVGYHALQRFCREIEPGAPGIGILHPHGVALSWRCSRDYPCFPALQLCGSLCSLLLAGAWRSAKAHFAAAGIIYP
jgi:hypothetical protein